MARYVWRDGQFVDRATGEPMELPDRDGLACPYIASDIKEYASPITGKPITSRSERRDDLKRHDCVEADPPKKRRGYRNPKFAAKRGLSLNEEARDTVKRI